MAYFLTEHAQDDVLIKWRGLHLNKGKPIKKYIYRFWNLHLKAYVFEEIGFQAQKQQYCARIPKDMIAYINAQKLTTIYVVIHHSMLAYNIFYNSPKVVTKQSEKDGKLMQKSV